MAAISQIPRKSLLNTAYDFLIKISLGCFGTSHPYDLAYLFGYLLMQLSVQCICSLIRFIATFEQELCLTGFKAALIYFFGMAAMPFLCNGIFLIQCNFPRVMFLPFFTALMLLFALLLWVF